MSNSSIVSVGGETIHQLDKALHDAYEKQDEMRIEIARLKRDNRRLAIIVQELRTDAANRYKYNGGKR